MLQRVAIGLFGFLLVFLLVGLLLPSDFRVERELSISAPTDVIHRYVGDLQTWPQWTAWNTDMDSSLAYEFDGVGSGAGAAMRWTGDATGNGKLKITEADPASGIRYDLEMEGGKFAARGQVLYGAEGTGTRVTWADEGDLGWNPVYRWFALMMDGMLGPDLETGLAGLKEKAEQAHRETPPEPPPGPAVEGDDDSSGPGEAPQPPSGDDDSRKTAADPAVDPSSGG